MHEWYLAGESAAKNGFVGTTTDAGYPDTYTYTGDTYTLRSKAVGEPPMFIGGFTMGVTKSGGGRFKGNLTNGGNYVYVPSIGDNSNIMQDAFNFPAKAFQNDEIITCETDSANTNEVTLMANLWSYGAPHRYPTSLQEIAQMVGGYKEVHTPQFSITSAAAITANSGAVTFESASQEDLWIKRDGRYALIGVIPHLVDNNGLLTISGNVALGEYNANLIPIGMGAPTVDFRGTAPALPYEPIYFNMASQPKMGLYSTAAAATTFSAIILEL